MNTVFKCIIATVTLCFTFAAHAQVPKSVDYFAAIKHYDLTNLWHADSIQAEGDGDEIPFPEPLGYIGDNYQRFYIHYITIRQSKDTPYQYKVNGKTKVKNNICDFSGTITINRAVLYKKSDDPKYKQGSVTCDVL